MPAVSFADRRASRRARPIAAALALLTTSALAQAAGCPATEPQLVGSWQSGGNAGFFEEFSLEVDDGHRTFNSWLHQRPEIMDASWKFEHCQLTVVTHDGDGLGPFRFRVIGLAHGRLRLIDLSDRTKSVYVRMPDSL